MRRTWLASAAVAAAAISVPVTLAGPVLSGTARAATLSSQQKTAQATKATTKAPLAWNMAAAALARELIGDRYVWGGTSPAGFDCSGLTQWVYRHAGHGKIIDRTADAQFREFRQISRAAVRPGDLVFFHDSSSAASYVYHVGVFEGGSDMVAATTPSGGVKVESFTWAGNTVTFGTITH